jgi:hypothetical protein
MQVLSQPLQVKKEVATGRGAFLPHADPSHDNVRFDSARGYHVHANTTSRERDRERQADMRVKKGTRILNY